MTTDKIKALVEGARDEINQSESWCRARCLELASALESLAAANATLREECKAWRGWWVSDPHTEKPNHVFEYQPDRLVALDTARRATDAAGLLQEPPK